MKFDAQHALFWLYLRIRVVNFIDRKFAMLFSVHTRSDRLRLWTGLDEWSEAAGLRGGNDSLVATMSCSLCDSAERGGGCHVRNLT